MSQHILCVVNMVDLIRSDSVICARRCLDERFFIPVGTATTETLVAIILAFGVLSECEATYGKDDDSGADNSEVAHVCGCGGVDLCKVVLSTEVKRKVFVQRQINRINLKRI